MASLFPSPSRLVNPEVRAVLEARMSGFPDVPAASAPPPALVFEDDSVQPGAESSSKKRSRRKPDNPAPLRPPPEEEGGAAAAHKKPRASAGDASPTPAPSIAPPVPRAAISPAQAPQAAEPAVAAAAAGRAPLTQIGFGPEAPPLAAPQREHSQPPLAAVAPGPDTAAAPRPTTASATSPVQPHKQQHQPLQQPDRGAPLEGAPELLGVAPAAAAAANGPAPKSSISYYFKGGAGAGGAPPAAHVSPEALVAGAAAGPGGAGTGRRRGGGHPGPGDAAPADASPPMLGLSSSSGGGGPELATRLQASEAECQRLLVNIQSMKAALKDAADTVRAARGEAADARAAAQAEKEERAAERARVAEAEKEARAKREAAQAGLARIVQRAAQAAAITRLEELNAKTARLGRIVSVRTSAGGSLDMWEDGAEFLRLSAAEDALNVQREQLEAARKLAARANRQSAGRSKRARAAAAAAPEDESGSGDDDAAAPAAAAGGAAAAAAASEFSFLDPDAQAHLASLSAASRAVAAPSQGAPGSASASAAAFVDPLAALDRSVRDEGLKLALTTVRSELAALAERRRALEPERALLQLELNRHKHESASRWRHLPCLGRDGAPQFQLLQLLGRGGFSEVWRAVDLAAGREVAVKLHDLQSHWSHQKKQNFVRHALRESEIQFEMRHPHIVALFDAFPHDDSTFVTVLEFCGGTDLDQVLKQQGALPEKDAKRVLVQVLSALAFLNGYRPPEAAGGGAAAAIDASGATAMLPPPPRRRIIHYDLKPANILFDDLRAAKVTDFGLSKVFDDGAEGGGVGGGGAPPSSMELTSQGAGTYWYLPPECFRTDATPRVSSKVDVWAMGVIFYQMLYGRRPFGESQTQEQILQTGTMLSEQTRAGPQFPDRPAVSRGAQDFIRRCLTYSADARPDVLSACRDPYLLQGPDSSRASTAAGGRRAAGAV